MTSGHRCSCRPSFWPLLAALASAQAASSQTTWNVVPPDIQSAVNQANPGDTLVLAAGGYYPFTLNKGLTIVGTNTPVGYGPGSPTPAGIHIQVPVGQVANLIGIDCTYSYSPYGSIGTAVQVLGGSVRFDSCTLRSGVTNALEANNATVVVTGSTITAVGSIGTGNGIYATNSSITLRDCVVRGADSACMAPLGCLYGTYPAKQAVNLDGSTLHAERTTFVGGSQGWGPVGGAAGVQAGPGSSVWLANCTLTGGNTGQGGTALVNNGLVADLLNTTLNPGSPGGSASSGPVNTAAPLLQAALAPIWMRGATSTLTLTGSQGAPFALFLTPAATALTTAVVSEPVWFVNAVSINGGLLDTVGVASFSISVPNVPALQHASVWCQAISGFTLPLRASTIAGGVVR